MTGARNLQNDTRREFFTRVLPMTLAVWAAGIAASFWQHGFLIGGPRGVPLAGPDCHAALWHLLLLGFVAGYSMALVGGATGLVSLPYNMSVLGFDTIHVSPTVQLETFLNPFGALLGFYRSGQFSAAFALPLCVGAAIGAILGPFVRVLWLPNPVPFKGAVGVALIFVGIQMIYGIFKPRRNGASTSSRLTVPAEELVHQDGGGAKPTGSRRSVEVAGQPMRIQTLEKTWAHLRIGFGDEDRRMSMPGLIVLGAFVGVIGTTLGVGGGFLLVPLLAAFYHLPMRVIVAGSIPYVIVLSAVGLFSFNVTVPLLTGKHVPTEWAWGFFTGGAAIMGAWFATHSQRHIPEGILRGILGVCNGLVGILYVLAYFGKSPFKI